MSAKRGNVSKYFEKVDKRKNLPKQINGEPEPSQDDENPMILVADVAKMCRISRAMLYKLHAAGKMPRGVKLGNLTRWRRQEILDWIKAGCPPREKWEAMNRKK